MSERESATGRDPVLRRLPNHAATLLLVGRVVAEFALDAQPELVEVPDQEAAKAFRFLGSPTVRVDRM